MQKARFFYEKVVDSFICKQHNLFLVISTPEINKAIYAQHLGKEANNLSLVATGLRDKHTGGVFHFISDPDDFYETQDMIRIVQGGLGVDGADIQTFYIGQIITPSEITSRLQARVGVTTLPHTHFSPQTITEISTPIGIQAVQEKIQPMLKHQAPQLVIVVCEPLLRDYWNEGNRDLEGINNELRFVSRTKMTEAVLGAEQLRLVSDGFHALINAGELQETSVAFLEDDSYIRLAIAGSNWNYGEFARLRPLYANSPRQYTATSPTIEINRIQRQSRRLHR